MNDECHDCLRSVLGLSITEFVYKSCGPPNPGPNSSLVLTLTHSSTSILTALVNMRSLSILATATLAFSSAVHAALLDPRQVTIPGPSPFTPFHLSAS